MKLKTKSSLSSGALEDAHALLAHLKEGKPLPRGWRETLYRFPPKPAEMREIRKKLGFSQDGMARLFNTPKKTWQNWEQGLSRPGGAETVLFEMIDRDPDILKVMAELAEVDARTGNLNPPREA